MRISFVPARVGKQTEPVHALGNISFHDRAESAGGFTSGFHLMRLVLAVLVIVVHSVDISYGSSVGALMWGHKLAGYMLIILPMFFAMSGYLVAGSFARMKSLSAFFALRAIRIFPALIVVVFLTALVLGPLLTTLSLADYFSGWLVFHYFGNILGLSAFTLPGVFHDMPVKYHVNASLWTIQYDFICYVLFGFVVIFGLWRRKTLILTLVVTGCMIAPFLVPYIFPKAIAFYNLQIVCFFFGVLMFLFKEKIVHKSWCALASFVVAGLLLSRPITLYWAAPFVAYFTVYLGLLNAPKVPLIMKNDYSYGLYLVGYPLQQLQAYLFPDHREWYLNVGFSVGLGLFFAMASWHFLEKPLQARRHVILDIAAALSRMRSSFVKKLI